MLQCLHLNFTMTKNNLYSTEEQRLDTVGSFSMEDIKHWQAIKRAQYWFINEYLVPDVSESEVMQAFELWINSDYGIRLHKSEAGYNNYQIVDREKYLIFVLKFVK